MANEQSATDDASLVLDELMIRYRDTLSKTIENHKGDRRMLQRSSIPFIKFATNCCQIYTDAAHQLGLFSSKEHEMLLKSILKTLTKEANVGFQQTKSTTLPDRITVEQPSADTADDTNMTNADVTGHHDEAAKDVVMTDVHEPPQTCVTYQSDSIPDLHTPTNTSVHHDAAQDKDDTNLADELSSAGNTAITPTAPNRSLNDQDLINAPMAQQTGRESVLGLHSSVRQSERLSTQQLTRKPAQNLEEQSARQSVRQPAQRPGKQSAQQSARKPTPKLAQSPRKPSARNSAQHKTTTKAPRLSIDKVEIFFLPDDTYTPESLRQKVSATVRRIGLSASMKSRNSGEGTGMYVNEAQFEDTVSKLMAAMLGKNAFENLLSIVDDYTVDGAATRHVGHNLALDINEQYRKGEKIPKTLLLFVESIIEYEDSHAPLPDKPLRTLRSYLAKAQLTADYWSVCDECRADPEVREFYTRLTSARKGCTVEELVIEFITKRSGERDHQAMSKMIQKSKPFGYIASEGDMGLFVLLASSPLASWVGKQSYLQFLHILRILFDEIPALKQLTLRLTELITQPMQKKDPLRIGSLDRNQTFRRGRCSLLTLLNAAALEPILPTTATPANGDTRLSDQHYIQRSSGEEYIMDE